MQRASGVNDKPYMDMIDVLIEESVGLGDMEEEYDPLRPNDLENILRKKNKL